MSVSLVNDLSGLFRNQALSEAATRLGEPESSVMRGFQTAAAAIFGGLASRGSSQPGFIKQTYDLISSPANELRLLDNIRGIFTGKPTGEEGLGSKILSMLFGGQQSRVAEGISQASGLRPSSAATLMGLAAPIVMSVLGQKVRDDHLDASGLSNLLQTESTEVRSILPSSLLSSVQSASTVASDTARAREAASGAAYEASSTVESAYRSAQRAKPSTGGWLWPLLLGSLAVLGLLWFLGRGQEQTARITQQATDSVRSAANVATSNIGDFFRVNLPDGVTLNIPRNGIESRLVTFIQDRSKPVDTTTWFEFTRLSFDTNLATVRPESQDELNNLAAILKAYPNVRVKIGGYTDNTGDPAANASLSQRRADEVRQQLASRGIAPARMEAEGYGEQHPIADNATPEGRALNRRIALRVTQK